MFNGTKLQNPYMILTYKSIGLQKKIKNKHVNLYAEW